MKKYAVLILLFALLTVAPATFAVEKKKNSADTFRLLHLFGDVFEQVRSKYVESPTDQELIEAAISGMLTSLDPHSSYLSAKNFREMQVQTRGEFGGLGIEVTMDKGLVKVVSPIDDTPAHKAGIEPGDLIVHQSAGGGGCGDPRERQRELIERDVGYGYVSVQTARDVYGLD